MKKTSEKFKNTNQKQQIMYTSEKQLNYENR